DGSTIAVSVATDNRGRYSIPAARLEPGHYTLKIRAAGYDLDAAPAADVKTGATTTADLKLVPTKNLAAQLANAVCLINPPGSHHNRPQRSYALHTLPRPSGKSTHMIVTEYDLPRKTIEPHDVIVDRDGQVWYSDFGQLFIGRMDPKTGKVTEYPIPKIKEG